jgi:predicted nuclease of predicted toxin-antitoxin system
MKFLVDRCAGRRLADWLRNIGYDVVFAPSLGPDPGDESLLEWAADHDSILITIDTDFGAIVFTRNKRHRGIIRLPDVPSNRRIEIMTALFEAHSREMADGAMITIRGDKIRISHAFIEPKGPVQTSDQKNQESDPGTG